MRIERNNFHDRETLAAKERKEVIGISCPKGFCLGLLGRKFDL
jgi:hypothetical protein